MLIIYFDPVYNVFNKNKNILSVLRFESGPVVSLLLRITAVQTSLGKAMRVRSWRSNVEAVYTTAMKGRM